MASYNQDFNRMQEEALRRMREMQSRSRTAVNRPHPPPPPHPEPQPPQQHQHPNHNQKQHHDQNKPASQPPADILKSLLGDIKIDSEKALILLMLFVLYKNKADMKLLLALGYLII